MPVVSITTITGNESFQGHGTVDIKGFYRKTGDGAEQPFHIAAKDRSSGMTSIGAPEFINASDRNSNHGRWIIARYNVPEGACIKIVVRKKMDGDWSYHTGSFLLYARRQAALRRFRIPLVGIDHSNLSVGYFEGLFDILRPVDFEKLGIKMDERFGKQFEVDAPEEFFSDEVIESEVKPLAVPEIKTVTTRRGAEVRVVDTGPKRLIRTRKG